MPFVAGAQDSPIKEGMFDIRSLFPFSRNSIAGSETLTGPYGLIANVIYTLLMIAGAVAILFIIMGGFWYITSAGNEEQAEKGKNTLMNAIIGVVVIILSYVIINVVVNFVSRGV